ncbi:MAG: hypothetical protein AB7L65_02805 [Hyphomonadaceae bacterium]
MKLRRCGRAGPSPLWALAIRVRLAAPCMPFWRVVAECEPARALRRWPAKASAAVTSVFVWARSSEEAEGLAALALEEEGLRILTADAAKAPPAARPRRGPRALARTEFAFLPRLERDQPTAPPPRRGARA